MNALLIRSVPYTYRIRLLFGRSIFQFGLSFLAAGLLLVKGFFSVRELRCSFSLSKSFATTHGTVSGCRETHYSENRNKIVEVDFRYVVEGPGELNGVSYSPASCPSLGTEVEVEYYPENPTIARIRGMRCSPFPLGAGLFALLLPFAGFILTTASLRNGIRTLRLVQTGLLGTAQVVSKEATIVRVNRMPVYRIKLRFLAQDGQSYDAITKTHRVEGIRKGATVDLLYDPSSPARVVLLSDLPGPVTGWETGQPTFPPSMLRAISLLLLPIATLFAIYLLFLPT